MSSLIYSNKVKPGHFQCTKRFIDVLCSINAVGEFGKSFLEIHLKELKFKVEHQNNYACFLKPDISVNNNIFVYKLFDKRDTFRFIIVWIPHIDSSIPQDIFHLAIKGGFLRILRSAIFFDDFTPKGKELINRIESQTSKSIPTKRSLWKKQDFHHFSSFVMS